jgi:hypothetical protein
MKIIFKSKDEFKNKAKISCEIETWFDCLEYFQQFLQASGFIVDRDFDLSSVVQQAWEEHKGEKND